MTVIKRRPVRRNGPALFQVREATTYTKDERAFSGFIQAQLEQLLRGELNALMLLRRYHREPHRLGIPPTPPDIKRNAMRVAVVESIAMATLQFLHASAVPTGGPIAQSREGKRIRERQLFTTGFPHILIERTDLYDERSRKPLETEGCVRRIQNQHADVRVNRMLNAANLGIEIVKMLVK